MYLLKSRFYIQNYYHIYNKQIYCEWDKQYNIQQPYQILLNIVYIKLDKIKNKKY